MVREGDFHLDDLSLKYPRDVYSVVPGRQSLGPGMERDSPVLQREIRSWLCYRGFAPFSDSVS